MRGIVPETGMLRKLLEDANNNEIEYASSAFWQVFLQTQFHPSNNHAVVCEYSPDESLRRVDITVLRYDKDQHTLQRLILVEAKRPGKGTTEVEAQALEASLRALRNYKLVSIFAITTIGLYFRTWHITHQEKRLVPLNGESPAGTRDAYVYADSEEAHTLLHDIDFMMGETSLVIAPVVPSQANLLSREAFDTEHG